VLLDSGATHSFIALEWVTELKLRQVGKCMVKIATFNSNSKQEVLVVEAQVCKNHQTPEYITMRFLALNRLITTVTSHKLTKQQKERMVDHNITLADPEIDSDSELPIDILMGQDYYHVLQDGGELVLPGGLILTRSVDKTYIVGGTSVIQCDDPGCNLSHTDTNMTALSYSVSVESGGFKALDPTEEQVTIDRFSNLDALGIGPLDKELHNLLEKFRKDTSHNGTRYVVKLQLKEFQFLHLATNFPMAFNRFCSWLIKHQKKIDKTEYLKFCQIMKEQLDLGML
jgi:hypothetical protein